MENIALLKEAQAEILRLRRRNEILEAKVQVMDAFMCVLHTAPYFPVQGFSLDVASQLGEKIAELERGQAETPAESHGTT